MSVPNPGDEFLARVGLGSMAPELRRSFLAYAFEWVQNEIGDRLTENLTEQQTGEFESIMAGDEAAVNGWISAHAPGYQNDDVYLRIKAGLPDADEAALRKEYASSRWIEAVRPDFKEITKMVWIEVENMIRQNREEILAASLEDEQKN